MNNKEDILNAWITMEQLSEGSINRKDKSLKFIHKAIENWHELFTEFLMIQKEKHRLSDKSFAKSGVVLYFELFDFQEIIDLLRKEYNIAKTDEEISTSDKFTLALYLDNQLNFIADKLFFTMSGYIRLFGELPTNFSKIESKLREELNSKFDEDFNECISYILQTYEFSVENSRYAFVKNLESGDVNLHSFFIEDLNKAKTITTPNLDRYFNGFSGERKNLDSNKSSLDFNLTIFEDTALQPKRYPLGRYPSNPNFALSLMQQAAVNLALHDNNTIRSVNGPPGTGKTTLLKDIFAELVLQQAAEIARLSEKKIKGSLVYYERGKIGILPAEIADHNMVVASSNNGAVQNIVKELPKEEGVAIEFRGKLNEVDYFKAIANSELSAEGFGNKRKIKEEPLKELNWGLFSLEGGNSSNINKLILYIEAMEKELDVYVSENTGENVYEEFTRLYEKLKNEQAKIQKYSEKVQKLYKLNRTYKEELIAFKQEEQHKRLRVSSNIDTLSHDVDIRSQRNIEIERETRHCSDELDQVQREREQAERNYNVIHAQKPSFFWIQKLFKRPQVKQYVEQLSSANHVVNTWSQKQSKLYRTHKDLRNQLEENIKQIGNIQRKMENVKSAFDQWIADQKKHFKELQQQISSLEKFKAQYDIQELDFSLSYEELQKSNPWFTVEFRKLQSELFISALKVRKQFLYENKKSLKAARIIWSEQPKYIDKENGRQLIAEAWKWVNFAVPVISTTFASFGRMFRYLHENSIGNLFIDEAGQALPQASVGAIFRSKKVMVVGDPAQITPVMTLDSNLLNLIKRNYNIDEKFVDADASTQTLVDSTSQYGFQKNDGKWIGVPLWVHRRCQYPMMTISNQLSYGGLMVQGKNEAESKGKARWYHSTGKANDKFVNEQADLLKSKICAHLQEDPSLRDEIYVITPFKNVASNLVKALDEIDFTKRENGKPTNVGTVHTFQGKEAKIVYFVLGCDFDSEGAATWAVSKPNMMNVAATRAKEEFYVIGDKKLYASFGSTVVNETIAIIDRYNNDEI